MELAAFVCSIGTLVILGIVFYALYKWDRDIKKSDEELERIVSKRLTNLDKELQETLNNGPEYQDSIYG